MTTTPTVGAPELVHGRHSTYTHGKCRCPKCTLVATAWDANARRQKAYDRWQPYVSAIPVRNHVENLNKAGMTWHQIADAAGINWAVVRNLLVGKSRSLRAANAHALLNVQPPTLPPAGGEALVDTTRSCRQLQALVAAGWPLRVLGRRAGLDLNTIVDAVYGRKQVRAGTAHTIHVLYGQLWDQFPAEHGVRPHDIARSQRTAAKHHWAPALAWDDDTINNPDALPDWTGRCGTTGGYYDHTQLNTPTCQPCRDAVAAAATERKFRRRARQAQQAA